MLFEPGDPLKRSPGFVSFGRQRVYVTFEINNILSGMFGFQSKAYFAAESGAEKAPKVEF